MAETATEKEYGTFKWDELQLSIRTCQYEDGTFAVMLRDVVSHDPVAILSLNLSHMGEDSKLPEGEFWGKNYSENAEIFGAMVRLGLIEPTDNEIVISNWVKVESWRLA